jgi:secondary thiamine-phosphate synthase enzyme
MPIALLKNVENYVGFHALHDLIHLRTERPFQFVDVTEMVVERVRRAAIETGFVAVQVLHTTAAVVVNENEPLLLQDLRTTLERVAPRAAPYEHDDLDRRGFTQPCAERENGHAHCKALFLPPSVVLGVSAGRMQLGRWQRIFLVELDGGQRRGLSVVVLGTSRPNNRGQSCVA